MEEPTIMPVTAMEARDIAREVAQAEVRKAMAEAPTLETLRPVLSQMVQERWVSQSYPVMNSIDLTTRSIETSLGRIHTTISDINSTLGRINARIEAQEERLDGMEAVVNHPEKGLAALERRHALLSTEITTLRNTIHGNPEERSGNPSLFERLDAQDEDRNEKHNELMNSHSTLVKRVERVEQYIERRQAWETRIVGAGKKLVSVGGAVLHDWRFWLGLIGTGVAIATALLAGQHPQDVPNMFDLLR